MSIADEFKLKKIPRAYYAPNKRTLVNTNTGEVQVQKKAVKIGLKPLRLVSKERERSKKEKVKRKRTSLLQLEKICLLGLYKNY